MTIPVFTNQPLSATQTVVHFDFFSASDQTSMVSLMQALYLDLNDVRSKFNLVQQALNAGTAVGAVGYPNGTMQINSTQYFLL